MHWTGRYWARVSDERRKKPYAITLADKNAPNEEVWRQVKFPLQYVCVKGASVV